jgi:hypothetical protein
MHILFLHPRHISRDVYFFVMPPIVTDSLHKFQNSSLFSTLQSTVTNIFLSAKCLQYIQTIRIYIHHPHWAGSDSNGVCHLNGILTITLYSQERSPGNQLLSAQQYVGPRTTAATVHAFHLTRRKHHSLQKTDT